MTWRDELANIRPSVEGSWSDLVSRGGVRLCGFRGHSATSRRARYFLKPLVAVCSGGEHKRGRRRPVAQKMVQDAWRVILGADAMAQEGPQPSALRGCRIACGTGPEERGGRTARVR